MITKSWGDTINPTLILIHGGGLSWWAYDEVIQMLKEHYHVVAWVIRGHADNAHNPFISIQNSAQNLTRYIEVEHQGHVYGLIGLSLGAQIIVEAISSKHNLCNYAIVESALVCPMPLVNRSTKMMVNLSHGLIKREWFAKLQAKALNLSESLWQNYYDDSLKMSKQSLIAILKSNSSYTINKRLKETQTKVLIIAGQKEHKKMLTSAKKLNAVILNSSIYIGESLKHGELSLNHPGRFIELIETFFTGTL